MAEELKDCGVVKVDNQVSPKTIVIATHGSPHLTKTDLQALDVKNRLGIRSDICRFLTKALGFSTVCCFALVFFQGFHAWGFQMDEPFLRWLCGATIVQLVAFLGIFTRAVWEKPMTEQSKPARSPSKIGSS